MGNKLHAALNIEAASADANAPKYLRAALNSLLESTKFKDLLAATLAREGFPTFSVTLDPNIEVHADTGGNCRSC